MTDDAQSSGETNRGTAPPAEAAIVEGAAPIAASAVAFVPVYMLIQLVSAPDWTIWALGAAVYGVYYSVKTSFSHGVEDGE